NVHGKVPRGDHRVDSPRLADRDYSLVRVLRRNHFAVESLGFLGGEPKALDRLVDFGQRLTEIGLALLLRQFPGQLISPRLDLVGDPVAEARPIPDGKPRGLTGGLLGSDN